MLVQDREIKDKWKLYFHKFCNESQMSVTGDTSIEKKEVNQVNMRIIQKIEVEKKLERMKLKRASPDGILIEA